MFWILILAVAAYVLFSSNTTIIAPSASPVSPSVTNPTVYKTAEIASNGVKPRETVITRVPPPGYSGPVNGPFKWASAGNPPNGVYTTIGNLV
jgi:hypothetical protein